MTSKELSRKSPKLAFKKAYSGGSLPNLQAFRTAYKQNQNETAREKWKLEKQVRVLARSAFRQNISVPLSLFSK